MIDWPLQKLEEKLQNEEERKKNLIEKEIRSNWKEIERRNCKVPSEIKEKLAT